MKINDYLLYYKDFSLDDVKWNDIDNLLCAILVYLPSPSFKNKMTLKEFYQSIKRFKNIPTPSFMVKPGYEVLERALKAKRYKNLKISNFISIKNNEIEYTSCCFTIGKIKIISYRGTDGSVIGWLENFRISYMYPTLTQKMAIKYLRDNVTSADSEVYVVGHSKGGNLAMVSALENISLLPKIVKILNFDGPGLRKEQFENENYKALKLKLVNIVPDNSYIGILMYNDDYVAIKTNKNGLDTHYATVWQVFGQVFVSSTLSKQSMNLHRNTTIGIEDLDYNLVKETFEVCFKSLQKEYSHDFRLNLNDVKNFLLNMKDVDPKVKDYILKIIGILIQGGK